MSTLALRSEILPVERAYERRRRVVMDIDPHYPSVDPCCPEQEETLKALAVARADGIAEIGLAVSGAPRVAAANSAVAAIEAVPFTGAPIFKNLWGSALTPMVDGRHEWTWTTARPTYSIRADNPTLTVSGHDKLGRIAPDAGGFDFHTGRWVVTCRTPKVEPLPQSLEIVFTPHTSVEDVLDTHESLPRFYDVPLTVRNHAGPATLNFRIMVPKRGS